MRGHRWLKVLGIVRHLLQRPLLQSRHPILEELAVSSQQWLNRCLLQHRVEMTHCCNLELRIFLALHDLILSHTSGVFGRLKMNLLHLAHIHRLFFLSRHPKHRFSLFLHEILRMRQMRSDILEHRANYIWLFLARFVCVVH